MVCCLNIELDGDFLGLNWNLMKYLFGFLFLFLFLMVLVMGTCCRSTLLWLARYSSSFMVWVGACFGHLQICC